MLEETNLKMADFKTSNQKCNFLEVLSSVLNTNFPDLIDFTDEITVVREASSGMLFFASRTLSAIECRIRRIPIHKVFTLEAKTFSQVGN
jgi:hypothetical protein